MFNCHSGYSNVTGHYRRNNLQSQLSAPMRAIFLDRDQGAQTFKPAYDSFKMMMMVGSY